MRKGSNWSAGYRGDGLRGWKQVNGSRVYYLYDGMNAVLEEDGSGKIVAEETFGPEGPLARSSGGRVLLYTPDGQGNVSQQVDAGSGNVVASYLFDGYGVRKVASNDPTASQDPYSGYGGLEGYYTDWGTGLCLLGYRYYDVLSGRFLTRDPIGFEGGINLYEYVNNAPVSERDRDGLSILDCLRVDRIGNALWSCIFSINCTLIVFVGKVVWELSCIIGATCSIIQAFASEFCNAHMCRGEWSKWLSQNWQCLLVNALIGCVGGIVGTKIGNIINDFEGILRDIAPWLLTFVNAHIKFLTSSIGMICTIAQNQG
jgi:RHS repeat-associated protein